MDTGKVKILCKVKIQRFEKRAFTVLAAAYTQLDNSYKHAHISETIYLIHLKSIFGKNRTFDIHILICNISRFFEIHKYLSGSNRKLFSTLQLTMLIVGHTQSYM